MPRERLLTARSPAVRNGANCPYTGAPLQAGNRAVACSKCGSMHESASWRSNNNHCAQFTCSGRGRIVTLWEQGGIVALLVALVLYGLTTSGFLTNGTAVIAAAASATPAVIAEAIAAQALTRAAAAEATAAYALTRAAQTVSEATADSDSDGDGLSLVQEADYGTAADDADSDDDHLLDGDEVNSHQTDPLDSDSDNDGRADGNEVAAGTNPRLYTSFRPPTATLRPRRTLAVVPTATPQPPTATPRPPTATPRPPTATPRPPTATPQPPTATPQPPWEWQEIGRSVSGQTLQAARFGAGPTAVVFIGGLHAGFAPATVQMAESLIERLRNDPSLVPTALTVYVVPIVNLDAPHDPGELPGRLNANGVDLNRNWDCNWTQDARFRNEVIPGSGGPAPFSEPEVIALRDFIQDVDPVAVVFWEALYRDGLVSPGRCSSRSSVSYDLARVYGRAAGYSIDDFEIDTGQILNGDGTNWLDAAGIPAVAVLLPGYETVDWSNNWAGILAVLEAAAG